MTKDHIIGRITQALEAYTGATSAAATGLIPEGVKAGKLYEAHVLACVARDLATKEGLDLLLVQGSKIVLKGSPGPINRQYPHIRVSRSGLHIADIWTDVEVTTLSYHWSRLPVPETSHYHELDIVVVERDSSERPTPSQLWLGIECKHTTYSKAFLRQILGMRRELSLFGQPKRSKFSQWPASTVPGDPASCLVVYSSSAEVLKYTPPGDVFGIRFVHEPLY